MSLSLQRVLLVDDDEDDFVIVRDLLSDITGGALEIEWVSTYEAAYAALTHGQYDVCLLDYQLGRHTGLELLHALPAKNFVPTILLTGSEDYQIDVAAAKAGAADYLIKGDINAPLLERSIRYAIQRKISEDALLQAQRFAQATVDALPDNIAVLDEQGVIVAVNAAWRAFAKSNGSEIHGLASETNGIDKSGIDTNYLSVCESSEGEEGRTVAAGIRAVMAGDKELFCLEYLCQTSSEELWFEVRVKRFLGSGPLYVVVAHENITARKLAEQQIQIHSHLLNIIGQAVIVTDAAGIVTYWNDFAEKLYGWSSSEALGRNILNLTPADMTKEQGAEIMARLTQGESWSGEFLVQKRDGTPFPAYVINTPVLDQDGQVVSIIGLSLDITERKRAEERLQQSEANLAQAQQIAHLGSWELSLSNLSDLKSNALIWSDEVFRIFGYEPRQIEVSREVLFRAVHPDDRERIKALGMQALREKSTFSLDHRIVRPDGTERVVHEQGNFVFDAAGNPLKIVGIVQDVTERKRAEDLLREREEFQRALLENFPNGSVNVFDRELRYVMAAGRGLERSGMIPAQLLGKAVHEVFSSEQVALATSHYQSVIDGKTVEFELPHQGRFFNINAAPLLNRENEVANILVVAQDITARKQTEAALEATTQAIIATWESMTDAFFNLDATWCFTHINSQAARLWQRNAEELIGKNLWDEFPAAVAPKFHTEYHRAIEEQVAVDFEAFFPPHNIWYEVHAYPSPVGLSVYFRDISERKQAEEALRISIERFEILSRATNDAVWDWNLTTSELWWNEGLHTLFGYRKDAIEPGISSWKLRIHPDDLERVNHGIHQAIDHGQQSWSDEYRFRRADGSYAVIFDRGFVIRDANDLPIRMVGSMQDITDRKQAEEALRASEERFQSIVDNVPGMVYQFVRHPDGSIEWPFVSPSCQEMFEVKAQDIKNHPALPLNMIHPDDRAEFDATITTSEQTLVPWIWEGRLRTPSGKSKWVQGTSSPQRLPDGGSLCTGLLMDVTARKEAESQRDRFFTMSLDMLGVVGFDGYFKRLNPAFSETLGYSEAELMSKPFLDFVHLEDRDATQGAIEKLTQGDLLVGFTNRYLSKSGVWRWLEWKSVAVVEEGVIYAAARDVTDRREAETALLLTNDALEERVAARTMELENSNAALQFQIAEREGAEAQTRTRARQQEAVAELGHRALTDVDIDTLLADATTLVTATLDVEFSSVLELMPGGESLRFRADSGWSTQNSLSISEVLMPADIQSQSGYALLSKSPLIVTDLRTETRFEPSPFLLKSGIVSGIKVIIGGYEEPFGTLGAHTIHPREFTQDDVNFLQAIANVLAAALERYKVESEIRQLNTQLKNANENLRIENIERFMALGTLREVTTGLQQAKDEAEQAKENAEIANRAKSEFLSRMSHELRTPLNAILGFGQILDREELTALQKESIGYILKGGRHLLSLINEVLDIARVEAGHIELSIEPISLVEVVAESCALVRPLAAHREIRFGNDKIVEDCPDVIGHYVMADRQRLKQVLINLLSNAIKYNRQAGEVIVSVHQVANQRVQLRVRDSGFGMTVQDIQKLFTPFERLSAADSEIEGTGLGLVLSQRLMASMGGSMGVESIVEQGSTFWIELPQAEAPLQALAESPISQPESLREVERVYTVLSIEDNLSNIRLLEAILESRPEITLLTAMQGSIGLDLAREHLPDLILLDLHLPGMPGIEVLKQLRQSADTKNIPVIVISADATPSQIERLLGAGAIAYLTKPLNVVQFLSQLDEVLRMSTDAKSSDSDERITE
ncbi:PAS domain S-box-containing protein [Abditibacterium utsteinense]|uniref:histidine kinase n=1 Tax=Abditibacterium utsteinense TaxID=1960156 RepID=A0A2S8SRA0_9BACT|nr:PAS domain S-box protein [Abditibacterium utsteinense]PQV63334.1 PAS domain S-box-containing protein [Abditibacterium utsteinense]